MCVAGKGIGVRRSAFLVVHAGGFQVFGLEDLAAIQALDVIYAVAPGDNFGPVMLTSGLHRKNRMRIF